MEKKLLVAVDGSVYSSNIIHYLAQLFGGTEDIRIHLFCAAACGPLPVGHGLLGEQEIFNLLTPAGRCNYEMGQRYIDKAVDQLTRGGITMEQITSQVQLCWAGTATDIVSAARHGLFDALVLGRRGLGRLEQMFIGSVSQAVIEKSRDVPVWLIDGKVHSGKFLVPVDGTPHTLRAVDHLCYILQGNVEAEFTLFHSKAIFAQKPITEPQQFHYHWHPDWCAKYLNQPDSHFRGPEQLLIEAGFSPDRIHRLETSLGMTPSRQIVRQAMIDEFGTIVMGRRPGDIRKKGIFGSVSGQVVAMAVNCAIWIVG